MLAAAVLPAQALDRPASPKGQLNKLADIGKALQGCWEWPPISDARPGIEFTIQLSFRRNGEVFGARITGLTPGATDKDRLVYYQAALAAISRCSPLPLSESLGAAIAGRQLRFHIRDTRQERKA